MALNIKQNQVKEYRKIQKLPKFKNRILSLNSDLLNNKISIVEALKSFINEILPKKYSHILADPDKNNLFAIKTYEKAGFKRIKENLMMKCIKPAEK